MLAELKRELAELDRAAQAARGRDEDLAGMVAGLNRALGALFRVLEEERPEPRRDCSRPSTTRPTTRWKATASG